MNVLFLRYLGDWGSCSHFIDQAIISVELYRIAKRDSGAGSYLSQQLGEKRNKRLEHFFLYSWQ